MALVDLKTDLKSLKFESGLNRKPFVVKDIDQEGGRNSGLAVQGILAAKRIDDVVRMAKLVIAKPGLTYAIKGALSGFIEGVDSKQLYENNPKLGKQLLDKAKDILLTAVTNTAQVPLNGLGLHLYKGNLNLSKENREYQVKGSLINPAHSRQISQGIKKSKKLKLADFPRSSYGKIDYLEPIANVYPGGDPTNTVGILKDTSKLEEDIVPFYFKVLGKDEDNIIQFRAFLDSLSDSYNGMWNKTQFLGRPEQFKTYNGFERTISFSFKIAAQTRHELKPLYRKLNYLASTTAPSFSDDGYFMRGTLVKINIGDYLSEQLCNIATVGISWQQDYQWETKQNKTEETDVQILPHVLDVNITAEAIHEFVPQTGGMPYITNTTTDPILPKPVADLISQFPEEIEYIEETADEDSLNNE